MADKLDISVRYIAVLRAGQHYNKDANVCTHIGLCVFFLSNTQRTPPSTSLPETGISFCLCGCPQSSREIASIRI